MALNLWRIPKTISLAVTQQHRSRVEGNRLSQVELMHFLLVPEQIISPAAAAVSSAMLRLQGYLGVHVYFILSSGRVEKIWDEVLKSVKQKNKNKVLICFFIVIDFGLCSLTNARLGWNARLKSIEHKFWNCEIQKYYNIYK